MKTGLGKSINRDAEYEKEQVKRARKQSKQVEVFVNRLISFLENRRYSNGTIE
jgi:hypothetical protein